MSWDEWGSSTYDMTREDLIIAEKVLDELMSTMPVEREWSDASGKFKITATYVDSKQGFVLLRKPNGEQVSVPISKLSLTDRKIIYKLSRAKAPNQ